MQKAGAEVLGRMRTRLNTLRDANVIKSYGRARKGCTPRGAKKDGGGPLANSPRRHPVLRLPRSFGASESATATKMKAKKKASENAERRDAGGGTR